MNTPRPLLAALAAVTLAIPGYASARTAWLHLPGEPPASADSPVVGGRTDQQFWDQATWLNTLNGLNLDRSSVEH